MHTDFPRPLLILVRGLPGSGKSYLAHALAEKLGADEVVSLDPDGIDTSSGAYQQHVQQLTTEGVDPKLHLYRFSRAQAYRGIVDNKIIIWNQPFTNLEIFQKMLAGLETYAREHDRQLHVLVVEVTLDVQTAQQRVTARKQSGGHGPSAETFARFAQDYTSFADNGYSTISVSGTDEIEQSTVAVLAAASQVG